MPTTAADLVQLTRSEHAALESIIASLDESALSAPVLDGGWSIKDTLGHITTWERRIMRLITAADRGEEVAWPEPGFGVHEIDRLNERDFLADRDRSLKDTLDDARAVLDDYVRWIESFTDDEIRRERPYTPGLTLERMIRGNGDQHVREHRRAIEVVVRDEARDV